MRFRPALLALAVTAAAVSPAWSADEIDWGFRSAFRAYIYSGTGAPPITAGAGATCTPNPNVTRGGCDPKIGASSGVFGWTAAAYGYSLSAGTASVTGQGTVVFSHPTHFFVFSLIDPSFTIAGGEVTVSGRIVVDVTLPGGTNTDVTTVIGTFPLTGPPAVTPATVTWTTGAGAVTAEAATALGGFLSAGDALDPVTIVLPFEESTPAGVPVASKTVLLKDAAGKPAKRGLTVAVSKQAAVVATSFDPVADGATLRVVSNGFDGSYLLPASNWVAIAKKGVVSGYKYADSKLLVGPIKSATLVNGQLKISGKGAGLAHSLASQPTDLAVVFSSGGAPSLCLGTGGKVAFKAGSSFKAANNPAPAGCPGAPAN
ncbi:MAG: HtaA domain-containing protein [bacterium]|nr:HtaA domain-containing protein [bacterium]